MIRQGCEVVYAVESDMDRWDEYVRRRPEASLSHLYGWRSVIRNTYAHPTYYLMAVERKWPDTHADSKTRAASESVVGVLPIVHLRHVLFGNSLVSMPFLDGGGILTSTQEAEQVLLSEAMRLARYVGAHQLELRQESDRACCDELIARTSLALGMPLRTATSIDKVRMIRGLPCSASALMTSLKSKLRSQVHRPIKAGLTSRIGGLELLDDFYRVLLVNMRDLGSPVHSKQLMRETLCEFAEQARIVVVYLKDKAVASGIIVGFEKTMRNPWASSLREFSPLSPNMLLYFRMLEFACENGYSEFDFGRSSVGAGTYRFKEQWGAVPELLYWRHISVDDGLPDTGYSQKQRYRLAEEAWKRLPILLTQIFGPPIRKHIGL